MLSDIGVIGLGVMGRNLVLNLEEKNLTVSSYDNDIQAVDKMISLSKDKKINVFSNVQDFIESLKIPRIIIIMVPAGKVVDEVIDTILPYLSSNDIVIDGGNSYFKDTIRRYYFLEAKGIRFLGVGISGGEEGARKGPSLMVGGSFEAWDAVKGILNSIAAKVDEVPCCDYIGNDGAGHFVKMIHNGIEYADMQLISEAYFLMKELLKLSTSEIRKVFLKWNEGELNSYLIQITADVLGKIDEETGKPLVDLILDTAQQKGTGKWSSIEALDIGAFSPTIVEAVFARIISARKDERVLASKLLKGVDVNVYNNKNQIIDNIHDALYAAKICSYAQGFDILSIASKQYNWDLKLDKIASLWQGGCIIRAQFLNRIREAYTRNPNLNNLLLDEYFKGKIESTIDGLRSVLVMAIKNGIPVIAFASALQYYDLYRSERLPANLIQAQRDYFGGHTYQRIDKEGVFHTKWY
ncbi:NADP-dependent phosphogluconate dehydrogenase [Caldicellulosiruptoraceae bacterium PP1]